MSTTPTTMKIHGHDVPLSKVKLALKQAGMTQAQVATALGVHQTAISHYLTGRVPATPEFTAYIEKLSSPAKAKAAAVNPRNAQGQPIPPTVSEQGAAPAKTTDARPTVDTASTDDLSSVPFPVDNALKVMNMAEKAFDSGHISYEPALRKFLAWERAFWLLRSQGYPLNDAVAGSYDLVIRSKTIVGDEDRKFAEESFHTVFGYKAGSCTTPKDAPKTEHPAYSLARPLVEAGYPVWFYGPAGTGKTHTSQVIAKSLGRDYYTVQGTGDMTKDDFVGALGADNGSTVKHYGPLPLAMDDGNGKGSVLIIEEATVIPAEILMVLQQVLTGEPLRITGMGETEIITAQPGFAVIICDNTLGLGEAPEYVGTRRMNEAFRDRFYFLRYGRMENAMVKAIMAKHRKALFAEQNWS